LLTDIGKFAGFGIGAIFSIGLVLVWSSGRYPEKTNKAN